MIVLEWLQHFLKEVTSSPFFLFCFCFLVFLLILYIVLWLYQRNLKSTLEFLQKKGIPYTFRCTPLSYEVVPQNQENKVKIKDEKGGGKPTDCSSKERGKSNE